VVYLLLQKLHRKRVSSSSKLQAAERRLAAAAEEVVVEEQHAALPGGGSRRRAAKPGATRRRRRKSTTSCEARSYKEEEEEVQRAMMMLMIFFFFPVRAVIARELEEGRLGSSCHVAKSSNECGSKAWTNTSDLADQGTDSPCRRRFDAPVEALLGIGAADASANAIGTRIVHLRRAFREQVRGR